MVPALAAGLAFFSFLWLALALVGLLNKPVAWALVVSGAVLALIQLRVELRTRRVRIDRPSPLLPWLFAIAGLLITLPMTLTPPVSTDALAYHLALPKWYIQAGGIFALPDFALAAFPPQMQMLYAWILLLGQPVATQLLHLVIGLAAVGFAAAKSRQFSGSYAAAITAAVLLTTPVILLNMSWAWLDVATALFVLLGTAMTLRVLDTGDRRGAVLAGLFWGMAFGLKYTVVLYFAIVFAVALWPFSLARLRSRLPVLLIVAGMIILLFAPWLIHNAIIYGNPTHPIGNDWWGPGRDGPYNRVLDEVQPRGNVLDYARGIFSYTFASQWVDDAPGPLYLLALPILLLVPLGGTGRRFFAAGALAMLLLSIGFGGSTRYQIPAFFLLSIPIGIWLSVWWRSRGVKRIAAMALLLVPAISNLTTLAYHNRELFDPLRVALGFEPEDAYLRRMIRNYPMVEYLNQRTPRETRLLVIGEERLFYIDRPLVAGSLLDISPARDFVRASANGDDLARRLRAAGFTYILFDRAKFSADLANGRQRPYWSTAELIRFRDFLQRTAIPVMKNEASELYRIP